MNGISNIALDHDRACAFAVNLRWSPQPITRESLPEIPELEARYLYLCRRRLGDGALYGVRAGFFPTRREAHRFASSMRSHFRTAEAVLVCSKEFSASAGAGLSKRRSISSLEPRHKPNVTRLRPVTDARVDSSPAPAGERVAPFPTHGKTTAAATTNPPPVLPEQIEPDTPDEEQVTVGRPALLFCLLVAVVIYFESNFSVSSMSSSALFAMLLVAASGFLGRYLHTKTHRGPNGPRMTRQDVEREAAAIRDRHASIALVPNLQERLVAIEERVPSPPDALLESIVRPLSVALKTRWAKFRLRKIANRELKKSETSARITVQQREELKQSIHRDIVARLLNVRRVAQFDLHERLFSVWRTLHYPLFFVLLPAAAVHVFAL